MTFTDMIRTLSDSVVDSLADFDREVALAAGLDPRRVRDWEAVSNTYFGRTKWTKWQRKALDRARTSGLSIDQLAFIESRLRLSTIPLPAGRPAFPY